MDNDRSDSDDRNQRPFAVQNIRCPTCNGIGTVHREEQGQLVALIPLNDNRLKPRRTLIYVTLAVVLCGLIGGLCAFFLYPRNVTISSNNPLLQPPHVEYTNTSVIFTVRNFYNLSNDNFYSTPITSATVNVMSSSTLLLATTWVAKGNESYNIAARSTFALPIDLTFNFNSTLQDMMTRCKNPYAWAYLIWMSFSVTVTYRGLGHPQLATGSSFQRVACHNPPSPNLEYLPRYFETHKNQPKFVVV